VTIPAGCCTDAVNTSAVPDGTGGNIALLLAGAPAIGTTAAPPAGELGHERPRWVDNKEKAIARIPAAAVESPSPVDAAPCPAAAGPEAEAAPAGFLLTLRLRFLIWPPVSVTGRTLP
jgi:hypothetical protein